MNIDITKVKTLRNGLRYRHYATTDKEHHGAYFLGVDWLSGTWRLDGLTNGKTTNGFDLIEGKTWRAWKEGEAPKWLMLRWKNDLTGGARAIRCGTGGYSYEELFRLADWLHEDGTITPCGVEE